MQFLHSSISLSYSRPPRPVPVSKLQLAETMDAISRRASRANQVDALRLDSELQLILNEFAKSALRFYPSAVSDALHPEISAVLRTLIFANTVAVDVQTPGLAYSNLRLRGSVAPSSRFGTEGNPLSRMQKALHFACGVAAPYIFARLQRHTSDGDRPQLEQLLRIAQGVTRLAGVINLVLFLRHARFRSVPDRLAGVELVYADIDATRRPGLELLNRQLVWQGVAQLALFVAPLLSSLSLPAFIRRLRTRGVPGPDERGPGRGECPECGTREMCMPHTALPCRCVFCYACIAVPLERDAEWKCRRCNMAVHSVRRVCR